MFFVVVTAAKNDPEIGTHNLLFLHSHCLGIQVRTSWQWHGYLRHSLIQDGSAPLRMNLDETSIVLNHDDVKGVLSQGSKGKFVLVKKNQKNEGR